MAVKKPSAAVLAARARRSQGQAARSARVEWYIENVANVIQMTMKERVKLATHFLKNKVVSNISTPVGKAGRSRNSKGRFTKARVTERSKPGEFPRADTTQLMKSIFEEVIERNKMVVDGYVGTPLDYGAILEVSSKLNRSFIKRTMQEQQNTIKRILTGPLKS